MKYDILIRADVTTFLHIRRFAGLDVTVQAASCCFLLFSSKKDQAYRRGQQTCVAAAYCTSEVRLQLQSTSICHRFVTETYSHIPR